VENRSVVLCFMMSFVLRVHQARCQSVPRSSGSWAGMLHVSMDRTVVRGSNTLYRSGRPFNGYLPNVMREMVMYFWDGLEHCTAQRRHCSGTAIFVPQAHISAPTAG
jgi:hypothetical protein